MCPRLPDPSDNGADAGELSAKGLTHGIRLWSSVCRLGVEAKSGTRSDSDQFHMSAGGGGECAEVGGIGGVNLVTVIREEDHRSIDDVLQTRGGQQYPNVATRALV